MKDDASRKSRELAEQIADGSEIDWDAEALQADDAKLIEQFATLNRIAMSTRGRRSELPRDQLGDYRLLELLGKGGMGEVYLAYHEKLHQPVAIKMLSGEASQTSTDLLQEARTLAKLQHTNIGVIHNFVQEDGLDYLVMEYIAGETLRDRMDRRPMPESEIVDIAAQLADALAAAHDQGIVHRDLKPTNLMLREGVVKVLDFGLAKLAQTVDESSFATTLPMEQSILAGTVPYMSPEQIERLPLDGRSDLFSVGVILYEMATGTRPFTGVTTGDVLSSIRHDDFVRPRQRNPRISRKLEAIICELLEKRPTRRLGDARALKARLDALRVAPRLRATHYAVMAIAVILVGALVGRFVLKPTEIPLVPSFDSSLAVLPFVDHTEIEGEQELLAAGVTHELSQVLGQLRGLNVIARKSVDKAMERYPDTASIARAVEAESILSGAARNDEGRIDLDMMLMDSASGDTLWIGRFDEPIEHAQRLYATVALQIADQLELRLPPDDRARLMSSRTVDPEVYRTYLRGLRAFSKTTKDGFESAWLLFRQTADMDPTYAPAYAGMASVAALAAVYSYWDREDCKQRANAAAAKALALDRLNPDAHQAVALIRFFIEQDWDGAEQAFLRSYRLNPNNVITNQWFGNLLHMRGRHDEALQLKQLNIQLDPLTDSTVNSLGWSLYGMGRYEESLAQERRVLEINKDYAWAYMIMAWDYSKLGRHEEAIAAVNRCVELSGAADLTTIPLLYAQVAVTHGRAGNRERAKIIAQELEAARERRPGMDAWHIMISYDAAGEPHTAEHWLEMAWKERSPSLRGIARDAHLFSEELRSTEIYQKIKREVGL